MAIKVILDTGKKLFVSAAPLLDYYNNIVVYFGLFCTLYVLIDGVLVYLCSILENASLVYFHTFSELQQRIHIIYGINSQVFRIKNISNTS